MNQRAEKGDTALSRRVIIMGAAGRDFHNSDTVFRDDPGSEVVAFTAAQIPHRRHVIRIFRPALRASYELQEIGKLDLEDALGAF
jgi:predicted GTPase